MEFIDLKRQQERIRGRIDEAVKSVLDHGRYIMGPEVAELEEKLAAYVGVKHCITAASGTDALLISLMALGVGAGDEVITTPFTFIATAETIALLGAKPVFVDIDPRTYNLDPSLLEKAISPRVKAILPVSLYGRCADMGAINAIAARHALPVIEDGCQSFGGAYRGRKSCGLSTIGCTSFFPSKPLGCYGDGGACFTDDDELAARIRQLRVHGQDRRYHHPVLGVNGRLDTMQAAILLAKLEIFDEEVEARGRVAARYGELLGAVPNSSWSDADTVSVHAQLTVEVRRRDLVRDRLQQEGIPTAVHYPVPLHLQPSFAYLGHTEDDFPFSRAAADLVLSLPMHPYLTEEELCRISEALKRALQ